MPTNIGDRVLEQTTTTGTGNITLAGAVTGYRAFSAVATVNGDMFPYVIAGPSEWEVGIGTRLTSTTFARTSVTASSNAGALVNFSAGTKEVWIDSTAALINSMRVNNYVINGGMEVDQVNVGNNASITEGAQAYICDMFWAFKVFAGATLTGIRGSGGGNPAFAGSRLEKEIQITANVGAALGTNEYVFMATTLEGFRVADLGFGSGNARNVTIGFWTNTSVAGTMTYGIRTPTGGSGARSYIKEATCSGGWEYHTGTIPGDTAGTWNYDANAGMNLFFCFGATGNRQGTKDTWNASGVAAQYGTVNSTNFLASNGNVIIITGVSMVAENVPLSADMSTYVIPPFRETHELCQCYYEKSFDYGQPPIQNLGANTGAVMLAATQAGAVQNRGQINFRYKKRIAPVMTLYNPVAANAEFRDVSAGADCSASATLNISETNARFNTTGNASTAVGNLLVAHWVADSRF